MPDRIKVTFRRVYVINDADWVGSGEFYFIATVDGRNIGNRSVTFDAVEGRWINLPQPLWSAVVDVTAKADVAVNFKGKDEDTFFDEDLGSISYVLRRNWRQAQFRHGTRYFLLEWDVELEVSGTFGRHPPATVFACRENPGSVTCTTVDGSPFMARMEVHEVRPTPPAADIPPRRPAFPAGTAPSSLNTAGAPPIHPTDSANIIPNPPVIPILLPAFANTNTCARIEYSYYRPNTLAFADNDDRLVWSAVSIGGAGSVKFLGPARGTKIMVYGETAGEVRLECRFRGALFATYRALVSPMRLIPCRFNILNGPPGSQPRATPDNVRDHLGIANRFLRPLGLELYLDSDSTVSDGATTTSIPGIFRIRVPAGLTTNIPNGRRASPLNFRPNVMNFAYVFSHATGALGAASCYPASNAGATIADAGTPSSSWISPSGIPPEAASGPTTMTLLGAHPIPPPAGRPAAFAALFSMYVTDGNGNPSTVAGQQAYANTIAHEFGHILNLGHRGVAGDAWDDLVNYPSNENIMHPTNPPALAQDFDIIQARAVRQSPLVPP
jgi:hypothetical protein